MVSILRFARNAGGSLRMKNLSPEQHHGVKQTSWEESLFISMGGRVGARRGSDGKLFKTKWKKHL